MGGYIAAYKCCDERDFYIIWLDQCEMKRLNHLFPQKAFNVNK